MRAGAAVITALAVIDRCLAAFHVKSLLPFSGDALIARPSFQALRSCSPVRRRSSATSGAISRPLIQLHMGEALASAVVALDRIAVRHIYRLKRALAGMSAEPHAGDDAALGGAVDRAIVLSDAQEFSRCSLGFHT